VGIAAPVSSNISTPADLAGLRVGIPGLFGASYIGLEALLNAGGLTDADITLETVGFNQVEALSSGRVDAAVVYSANEPVQLEAQGFPVTVLKVSDYMELVANGLITNESTLQSNPDLVRRMSAALLRGIQDSISDPEAAYQVCLKHVDNLANTDQAVQKKILAESIKMWNTSPPGESHPQAWENMQSVMLKMGLISTQLDLSQAFTNAYLPPSK
jgi:NitT/TauT family transport system substrate-binding protein